MSVLSLRDLCLDSLAKVRLKNPSVIFPIKDMPVEIVQDLFKTVLAKADVKVYFKDVHSANNFKLYLSNDTEVKVVKDTFLSLSGCYFRSFVYAGKVLEDNKTLKDYGMVGGTIRTIIYF